MEDLHWWVTGIGVPVVTGLCAALTMLFRQLQNARVSFTAALTTSETNFSAALINLRDSHDIIIREHRRAADTQLLALQADLTAFKLRVSETFVSNPSMREFINDFERRIMHLLELNRQAIVVLDKKFDRMLELRLEE